VKCTTLDRRHAGPGPLPEERRFERNTLPHILNAAERSKGAAGFRCRQLDGRAAILMVVARPGGCELASSVCGSSARWPFTRLGGIPPIVVAGIRNTSRGVARISSRPTLALAPILPAMWIAGHLATPFITQLTDGLSELAAFRRRHAVEDCVRSAHRVVLGVLGLYRIGDLVHVLLLVGLMLLLMGALKARDAAAARGRGGGSRKS
jgi:hypothetical protein